jgi:hypothetical protein
VEEAALRLRGQPDESETKEVAARCHGQPDECGTKEAAAWCRGQPDEGGTKEAVAGSPTKERLKTSPALPPQSAASGRRAPPSTVVAHVPYGSSSTLLRSTSLASPPPSETSSGIPLSVLLTAPSCTPLWVRLPCLCSAVLVSGVWGHIPADYLHGHSPCLVPPILPQISLCKKKILCHIKMSANAWSTKC